MTTEEDFQRQLDEHPEDFQTRLVFADWLQERGDERAEGYRALGVNRFRPTALNESPFGPWLWRDLPDDWLARADARTTDAWDARRAAENAAAVTFAALPPERRAELLAATSPG